LIQIMMKTIFWYRSELSEAAKQLCASLEPCPEG